jgi:hypothetical protein
MVLELFCTQWVCFCQVLKDPLGRQCFPMVSSGWERSSERPAFKINLDTSQRCGLGLVTLPLCPLSPSGKEFTKQHLVDRVVGMTQRPCTANTQDTGSAHNAVGRLLPSHSVQKGQEQDGPKPAPKTQFPSVSIGG